MFERRFLAAFVNGSASRRPIPVNLLDLGNSMGL